jgi:hypothetical protein
VCLPCNKGILRILEGASFSWGRGMAMTGHNSLFCLEEERGQVYVKWAVWLRAENFCILPCISEFFEMKTW